MTEATDQHLSPVAARTLLEVLPEHIKTGIINHAQKIDYPVEMVLSRSA